METEIPWEISVETLRDWLREGKPHALLDVRTDEENEWVQLPRSIHIPLHELMQRTGELDASLLWVVYCHHGVRSMSGTALLRSAGLNALSLAGGIDAWSRRIDPAVITY